MLGRNWASFEHARWLAAEGAEQATPVQNMVWGIHGHAGSALIGAGLFARYQIAKPEQRDAIVEALYCSGNKNTILDVLAAAGVTSETELDKFMDDAIWAAADPLQQIYAEERKNRTRQA